MALHIASSMILLGHLAAGLSPSTTQSNYGYEQAPNYWYELAEEELRSTLEDRPMGVAKNVILFLGDGMGVATVTAGRILAGQKMNKKGEEHKLSFDSFPYTGFSKTYNTDSQITDSAASATAFLCGIKTNQGLLGLSAVAKRGMCNTTHHAHVDSILRWSVAAGKSTGIVTTTRITHATPAGAYAHSGDRDWETDRAIPESERACEDIALQLITRNSDINNFNIIMWQILYPLQILINIMWVIMGGGRGNFYPDGFTDPDPDPKFKTNKTSRLDGRNLIEEWELEKRRKNASHKFVYDKPGLDAVNVAETDFLLGLFKQGHLSYEPERNRTTEPSLTDMVEKAIGILSRNSKGFFLLVEGGRIDHAHHDSQASRSLHEVVSMAEAVEMATRLTSKSDTLMVVTADHSHVFSIAGYASRGNPILGVSDLYGEVSLRASDKMPYTTIVYGNGPGYNSTRENLTAVDTENREYVYQSAVPMNSETHGGEDVPIFAKGPQSFLYTGVHEQSYIPIVMAYASCVGPFAEGKKRCAPRITNLYPTIECKYPSNAVFAKPSLFAIILSFLLLIDL